MNRFFALIYLILLLASFWRAGYFYETKEYRYSFIYISIGIAWAIMLFFSIASIIVK